MSILGINLIPFPGTCLPAKIQITPIIAERIFQCLVAFAGADATQREAFKQQMSETATSLGRKQYLIRPGYYGPCAFYVCGDEWFVVTSLDDLSPRTREQVDQTNLKLAQLRDAIMLELYP